MLGSHPEFHLGEAEFTKDMVETMLEYFETYADEQGVVKIILRTDGLWLKHPDVGIWHFLGLAKLPLHMVQ